MTILSALLALLLGGAASPPAPARSVFLVPLPAEAGWQDLAFLAAVPAASEVDAGEPLVLALAPDGALTPEARDFLARYRPERATWVGAHPATPALDGLVAQEIAAGTADEAACALAHEGFARSNRVVLAREDDYASALVAAVLAARMHAPLLVCGAEGLSEAARGTITALGASVLVCVGDLGRSSLPVDGAHVERLRSQSDIARWLRERRLPVGYVAAAVPADRTSGRVRKLSLCAALLAAGRGGALAPLGDERTPPSSAAAARAELERFRGALGCVPETLCLVGLPDALPCEVVPTQGGVDSDPPSDLAYANVDADPFLELALGRFVAEDCAAGTLLAARSLAYEQLLSPECARACALAEWERSAAPLLANAGFDAPSVHPGGKPIAQDSPLASVSVLVHDSHSSWMQIGDTYTWDSRVLLAPCLVETGGCSPASLDQDPELRSVALRLLRNGAIGFVGNVRRAIAQQEIFRSEFWNAVLAGQSLGQANRSAQNRQLVAVLAAGESAGGPHFYELYNETLYGDPGLRLKLPRAPRSAPARVELRGSEVTVHGPAAWSRCEEVVVADWKYVESPALYVWRGAGVGVESSWDDAHHRNAERHVFTAEVRTNRRVGALKAIQPPAAPLGWDGKFFVDEHADGTRSVYFRIELLEADMAEGRILRQLDKLRLHLE